MEFNYEKVVTKSGKKTLVNFKISPRIIIGVVAMLFSGTLKTIELLTQIFK